MKSELLRKLELASAGRKQANMSFNGSSAPASIDTKVLVIIPSVPLPSALVSIGHESPNLIAGSMVSLMETMITTPPEETLAKEILVEEMGAVDAMGYYLADFINSNLETLSLELTAAKEKADELKYLLEQKKITNIELVKEIDHFEKARHEAREAIDHLDTEIRRANKKIEDLERRRHAKLCLLPNQQAADESLSTYNIEGAADTWQSSMLKELFRKHPRFRNDLLIVVLLGTSMTIGDGVLTPTISGKLYVKYSV
ncbi:hypothetical protein COCNU_01G020540 [Cocos nucifera]|uniref:Uncharacterized protein n=1 Tax=Cocos nucifera TaxID=13894 RepID=A0A8K0MW49_COCNU|nr:hypothetical protein COCNU_01G020540 [Cocos nucifera]